MTPGLLRYCPECGEQVPGGIVRHPACFLTAARLDHATRTEERTSP